MTAEMVNKPGPTVRVALHEADVRRDNAMLGAVLRGRPELVYRAAQRTHVVEFGIHRLLCPVTWSPLTDVTYCSSGRDLSGRDLIDRRIFSYGWQVHRVGRPAAEDVETRRDG